MKRFLIILFVIMLTGLPVCMADNNSNNDAEFVLDEVIVKTKLVSGSSMRLFGNKFGNVAVKEERPIGFKDTGMISVASEKPETLVLKLENSGKEQVLNAIEELSALPNIEYAHPNYIIRAADTVFTPEYNMEKISAPDA